MSQPPPYPPLVPGSPSASGSPAVPGSPPPPVVPGQSPSGFNWVRILVLGGAIGIIALTGLAMLLFLGTNLGLRAFAIGAAAAVLPVPFLVAGFLWLDRYEPEPWYLLLFAFGWGACVATAGALLLNTGAAEIAERNGWSDALVAMFAAPLTEETLKGLAPLLIFLFRRREFSGIVDGIVYAGLSGTGFAMVENILYVGGYGVLRGNAESGTAGAVVGVVGLIIMREVLSGFSHPLFTAAIGIGLGVAARSAQLGIRIAAPVAGWFVAMILHGTWNTMATATAEYGPRLFFTSYIGFFMPLFFAAVGVAIWVRSDEGRVVARVLPEYARAGWLSPPEVASLATLRRRLWARRWASRVAGDAGLKAMRLFQFTATRLALLRNAVKEGLVPADRVYAAEERHLLDALAGYRAAVTGRDPTTPPGHWDGRRYRIRFPNGKVYEFDEPAQPVMPVPVRIRQAGPPPPHTWAPSGYR